MKLSINTATVPGDLKSKLETISKAGFNGVELHEPDLLGFHGKPEDVNSICQSLGLSVDVLQPFRDFEGLEGEQRKLAFERLNYKLDLMEKLGAKTLMVSSSTHLDASGDAELIEKDLRELAQIVGKRGMRAALLALPWARHITSETDAIAWIEKIDSPHLGVALNSFFSLADGSQPARLRNIPADKVFHIQLSDAPGVDFDITKLKRHFGLLPGQGNLNLAGFVRIMAKQGYQGAWCIAKVSDNIQSSHDGFVRDAYRSVVNLLDEVARSEPVLNFPIPDLPPRVYPTGFEFIEFAVDEKSGVELTKMLSALCFRPERSHVSKSVKLWRQGAVNIVVNMEKTGFAADAFKNHGATVCDMGIRVKDAQQTVERATALGVPEFSQPVGSKELDIPAIQGVGGSVVHFIDEKSDIHRVWDIEFDPVENTQATPPAGLRRIDHVAQTMKYQEMQSWLTYYTSTFEMEKTSIVDVADPSGVVLSQALSSPEGEVRLNLNGVGERRTFSGAFLADRFGAGVQHIAFSTDNIFETSQHLKTADFKRLEISENYYADLKARFLLDDELIEEMQANNILYDRDDRAEYFQIYSVPIFEGFFFEIVERRNYYQGYGARNAPIRLAAQGLYQKQEQKT